MSSFPAVMNCVPRDPQPADPNSLEHYFSEAMRLEYEFFDQQDHVPPLFTAKFIQFVGVGNAQPVEPRFWHVRSRASGNTVRNTNTASKHYSRRTFHWRNFWRRSAPRLKPPRFPRFPWNRRRRGAFCRFPAILGRLSSR